MKIISFFKEDGGTLQSLIEPFILDFLLENNIQNT